MSTPNPPENVLDAKFYEWLTRVDPDHQIEHDSVVALERAFFAGASRALQVGFSDGFDAAVGAIAEYWERAP